jgi:ketosteroid isomerase-like protein
MTDCQAIADRLEMEALRAEYTDALTMHDYQRLASLFCEDGAVRMPHVPSEAVGRDAAGAPAHQLTAEQKKASEPR